MALDPFTTADAVRGVLGVNEEELSDATLALPMYEANLRLALDEIGEPDNDGDLVEAFDVVRQVSEADRTAPQRNLYDAVILFAPYPVALHLASSLPLFTQRSITDGKAGLQRHAESPFEDVKRECKQNHERFRQNLEKRWAAYLSTSVEDPGLPTLCAVSTPSTNPITG